MRKEEARKHRSEIRLIIFQLSEPKGFKKKRINLSGLKEIKCRKIEMIFGDAHNSLNQSVRAQTTQMPHSGNGNENQFNIAIFLSAPMKWSQRFFNI